MREKCGANVRGGGTCTLDPEHKRTHSTVTYCCDGCSAIRRGYPHATSDDGEYPNSLKFCFLCSAPQIVGKWY